MDGSKITRTLVHPTVRPANPLAFSRDHGIDGQNTVSFGVHGISPLNSPTELTLL